jgi:hypothetical protein
MALTYEQLATLMNDLTFRGRIKVCVLKYADSILLELNTVPAHNTRERWAMTALQNPDMVATQIQPPVVMDPAVQESGSQITDTALQAAVEGVVNKLL